jgi:Lectin C-type domain
MKLSALFALLLVAPVSAQANGPGNFQWTLNPDNGHFYALSATKTWLQAAGEADSLGEEVELATVRNISEHEWLWNNIALQSQAWIGYSDAATEGIWVWRSGEITQWWASNGFTGLGGIPGNWLSTQPDNAGGQEHYAHFSTTGGMWNDVRGNSETNPAILEWIQDSDNDFLLDPQEDLNQNGQVDPGETDPYDQDTDDDGLGDGEEANSYRADTRWLQGPNGDYYRLVNPDTWSNSSAAARAQGYELASVQDQAEANWLSQTYGEVRGSFWIGLNDFSGTMEWSDGNPVTFTQWATGEPNTTFIAAYVGDQSTAEPGNWYGDFAGLASYPAVWESPGPDAPMSATDPLSWDTDGDGLSDGMEDGVDTIYWDGHGIPGVSGTDPGVFIPDADSLTTTDPLDLDSDEDGIADGIEDFNGDGAAGIGETDASLVDTDGDSLSDGLELGLVSGTLDTDGSIFTPDSDPLSTTNPLAADTDGGGVDDGIEDQSQDGGVDTWETDPNNGVDEELAFYVSNLGPGLQIHFEVFNATPITGIFPAYSLTGAGPTSTTLGIDVALSLPITVLDPFLSNVFGRASIDSSRVPASIPPGLPIWIQAIEVPISAILPPRPSNPILLPVGSN